MRPPPVTRSASRPVTLVGGGGRRSSVVAGALLVSLVAAAALLAPLAAPYPPAAPAFEPYRPPGGPVLLGTDQLGRDVLSRLLWGARLSLAVGLTSAAASVVLGGLGGVACALAGGAVDLLGQRLADIVLAVPPLVLALALASGLGQSVSTVILALVLSLVPGMVRTLRVVALGLRTAPFVEAAHGLGASHWRIASRHLLPAMLPAAGTLFTLAMAHGMVVEASLSFLGAGVPADRVSWGAMVTAGAESLERAPWIVLAPGLALTLAVLGLTLLGDAARGLPARRTGLLP